MTTPKTIRVVNSGRVQGVCYRAWTEENATALGLAGWVRNRADGTVEAVFSGPEQVVDQMVQACRRGPNSAHVTGVSVEDWTENPGSGFHRRPTA